MDRKRIVITGMGVVSCFGTDVIEFYKKLLEGKSAVLSVTEFDASLLPTQFGASVKGFNRELFLDKKNYYCQQI